MVLGQLAVHVENLELNIFLTTYIILSQWIKNSNRKGKTLKLLEKNIFTTQGLRGQKDFLNKAQKVHSV